VPQEDTIRVDDDIGLAVTLASQFLKNMFVAADLSTATSPRLGTESEGPTVYRKAVDWVFIYLLTIVRWAAWLYIRKTTFDLLTLCGLYKKQ
jgi:hypothetical protein